MLETLAKHIKTNIAQYTQMFDTYTQNVEAYTKNNLIYGTELNGEYTLSGGTDGVASKSCINQTFNFANGQTEADCYFGDDEISHSLVAHKVNVGTAIRKDFALEIITDEKMGNCIIIYLAGTRADENLKHSISQDLSLKVGYRLGVMFKIDINQMEQLGCTNADVFFVNSVIGAKKENTSLVQFVGVNDRFFAGKSYVVDYEFAYEDIMLFDDIIRDRLKHFDSQMQIKI